MTEAVIHVHPDHIEAQTIAGDLHRFAYATMVLEKGDTKGAWVCRDTTHGMALVCKDPKFVWALTKVAGRSVRRALAPNSKRFIRQRAARVVFVLLLLGATVFMLWGTPKWVRFGLRSVAQVTPLDVDARLGRAWLKSVDLGGPILAENPWQANLDTLIARLSTGHAFAADFIAVVVDAPEIDAWALPGGPLIFKTALLRRLAAHPEAEAALVAHEMAHVTQRHLMQRLSQTLGITTSVQFFFGDIDAVVRTPPSQLQLDVLLRPEDETEADHAALELLRQAQLDPQGLVDLVVSLAGDARQGTNVPWLARGPRPDKRLADLRSRVRLRRSAPDGRPAPAAPSSPQPK